VGRSRTEEATGFEFLAPDATAFGHVDGDGPIADDHWGSGDFDDGPAPSKWPAVFAAISVGALLTVAVVAAAPWKDDTAAPAPTTVPTTVPSPTTTTDAGAVSGTTTSDATELDLDGWLRYGLSPPPHGFTQDVDEEIDPDDEPTSGWGEVWAVPNASRLDGRWLSVTLGDPGEERQLDGSTRSLVDLPDGRTATVDEFVDGVVSVYVGRLSIESGGFGRDELLALAASIAIEDDGPQVADDRPTFTDPILLDGLSRIWSGRIRSTPLDDAIFARAVGVTGYVSDRFGPGQPARPRAALFLTKPLDATKVEVLRLATAPVGYLPGTWAPPIGFDGVELFVGRRRLDEDTSVLALSWITPEVMRVTMLTDLLLDDALELLDDVGIVGGSAVPVTTSDEPGGAWALGLGAGDLELTELTTSAASDEPAGYGVVWASQDATRTEGSWVSLTSVPDEPGPTMHPGTWIAEAGTRTVRVREHDDGVIDLELVEPIDGWDVTMSARGRPLGTMLASMATLTVLNGRPTLTEQGDATLVRGADPPMVFLAGSPTDADLVTQALTGRVTSTAAYRRRGSALGVDPALTITAGLVDRRLCDRADCAALRALGTSDTTTWFPTSEGQVFIDAADTDTLRTGRQALQQIGSIEAQRRHESAGWVDPAWFGLPAGAANGSWRSGRWTATVAPSGWVQIDLLGDGPATGLAAIDQVESTFSLVSSDEVTVVIVTELDERAERLEVTTGDTTRFVPLEPVEIAGRMVQFGVAVVDEPGPIELRTADGLGFGISERRLGPG
jgi:hypothetical protein